jgi:Lrp/AsnC family transcriptional regulator
VFVEVQTDDHSADGLARFEAAASALPQVMEVYRMAGEVDYLLRAAIGSMAGI